MVARHKRWTVSVLVSLFILVGCQREGSKKQYFRVDRAYLAPERVKKGEKVGLVLETISGHGDIELQVEWRKNGLPIENTSSSELSSFHFQKGDSISANVTLRSSGKVVRVLDLGPVVCDNSLPVIQSVEISASDSTALSAKVKYEDIDGDSVTITKKWYRNGIPIHTGETLTTTSLQRGDTVAVEATPHDGEAKGRFMESTPVIIGNRPPRIVSAPPMISGSRYLYQVGAEDPDGDELSYNLKYGPERMEIDPTGLLSWDRVEGGDSLYIVEVEVVDRHGGSALQKFELKITEETENSTRK